MEDRQYTSYIQEFFKTKISLITGPRQVGKTTITYKLSKSYQYLNFDYKEDRDILNEKSWDRSKLLIIFDEIHKMKNWKSWVKGIYDKEKDKNAFAVTGSANLETYKKVGDSLAGRYFHYRVHPFDVKELARIKFKLSLDDIVERLLKIGGFPEPFLQGSTRFYNRWSKTHLDIILKQDLIDLENVRDIKSIELLIDLMAKRVGSPISYSSLARDLQVSDKTIKQWLTILENMYVLFKVVPFHRNIGRSNLKQPKYYFYDIARVTASEGARLENLVACSLLKECQFRQDCLGENWELFYLSKRGALEVDFLISKDNDAKIMLEVKSSSSVKSKNFDYFASDLPDCNKIQLVKNLKQEKTFPDGLEIRKLSSWLVNW